MQRFNVYSNLTKENVMDYLKIAVINNAKQLKLQAIEFMALHLKDLIKKPEFKLYGMSHPEIFHDIVKKNLNLQK